MLAMDIDYVELHPPVRIENGYQLRFTLMVSEMGDTQSVFESLKTLIEYNQMNQTIKKVWKLSQIPIIEGLKWKKNRKRHYKKDMVLLQHEPKKKKHRHKHKYTLESMSKSNAFSNSVVQESVA